MVLCSGDAETEAALIMKEALHSDVAGGAHASHANCVSSSTDNAARATSAELKRLKGLEIKEAIGLIEAQSSSPKTTDPVESEFAIYDYVLRLGAGFGATAGVAQSISMKAMATHGEKQAKAKEVVAHKRAKGIGLDMSIEKQVANQLAAWDTMSFFALPKERRWVIIKSVRMAYKETAKAELVLLRKMDEAKAARLKAAREEEIAKFANRSLKYAKFAAMVVIASTAMLLALVTLHAGSPKELVDALLDQIRIRRHVYGVSAADLPCMGAKSGTTAASEAVRLRQAFESMVEKPLPAKPPPPTP